MSHFPTTIYETLAPVGVASGSTVSEALATLEQGNSGVSHGRTEALAFFAGISQGATVASGSGRLNVEPNVPGAGISPGATTSLAAPSLALAGNAGRADGSTSAQASPALATSEEFGFTIFLTITDTAVNAAAQGRIRRQTARLKINDVEVPISSFSLPRNRDALGAQLSVTLAQPLRSQIPDDAVYKFEAALWASGAWRWQTLLAGGKLAGSDYSISWQPGKPVGKPGDTVSFSTIDELADRWQLRPNAPTTIYDPAVVNLDTQVDVQYVIRLEDGTPLLPVFEPVAGLTLYRILERVYVTACGFESVQTNIPDFPVERADFSLEGGWHEGAAPLVAPFDPLYFPDDTGTLWIIERGAPLPAGFSANTLTADVYKEVGQSRAARATTNALLLIYQERGGDYFTTRFDQEPPIERGNFGDPGYTRTEVTRKVREYRNTSQPTMIVREAVEETKTEVINHLLETIHREIQIDQYDALGRKTGHTRTVEALLPTIEAGQTALLPVRSEQCTCSYRPHPQRPSESLQDSTVTYVSGLILSDNDSTYLDQPFKLPLVDAHRNGFIDLGADQERLNVPIKTKIETLRVRGDGVVEVYELVLDHLANTSEMSEAQPRVGAVSFNARGGSTKQVLLIVPGTEGTGRRIAVFNAGSLARDIALALGRRRLNRLNSPPHEIRFAPVGVDFSLRRGSVREVLDRDGVSLGVYMIESLTTSGALSGSNDFQLQMTAQGVEVADA